MAEEVSNDDQKHDDKIQKINRKYDKNEKKASLIEHNRWVWRTIEWLEEVAKDEERQNKECGLYLEGRFVKITSIKDNNVIESDRKDEER